MRYQVGSTPTVSPKGGYAMRKETLLLLHLRRAARKDSRVVSGIGASRHTRYAALLQGYRDVSNALHEDAARDAVAVANVSRRVERDAATDNAMGRRHWRYDGAARQGADGRWYDASCLTPTPRDATRPMAHSVKGSARPFLCYDASTIAGQAVPQAIAADPDALAQYLTARDAHGATLAASMAPSAVQSRVAGDASACVDAARIANGASIDALATHYARSVRAWSRDHALAVRDAMFNAIRKSQRGNLNRALRKVGC